GRYRKVYLGLYVHRLFLHAIQVYVTFNVPILFRHLNFSEAKKQPISEINIKEALEGLDMNMSQVYQLCILLGCDYLEPIKDVGQGGDGG
ncbi:hypothetical protein K443DRAFT_103819, partial [Laccaria amethystina LaAM-08-1]